MLLLFALVCKAQSDMLQRSFTIAGSCSMLSNLLLGIMFDKYVEASAASAASQWQPVD